MSEGTRFEQIKNKVCTQMYVLMQEVRTEFRFWMDSMENKLCNNLWISLTMKLTTYEEKSNNTKIQQIMDSQSRHIKLRQQEAKMRELLHQFPCATLAISSS